jgi:hypothetical protein
MLEDAGIIDFFNAVIRATQTKKCAYLKAAIAEAEAMKLQATAYDQIIRRLEDLKRGFLILIGLRL